MKHDQQFSVFTTIAPELGRQLAQPLIKLVQRYTEIILKVLNIQAVIRISLVR